MINQFISRRLNGNSGDREVWKQAVNSVHELANSFFFLARVRGEKSIVF